MIQKKRILHFIFLILAFVVSSFVMFSPATPVVYAAVTITPTLVPVNPTETPVPPPTATAVPNTPVPTATQVPATETPAPAPSQEPTKSSGSSSSSNPTATPEPTPVFPEEMPELGYGPPFSVLVSVVGLIFAVLCFGFYVALSRIFSKE